MKTVSIDEYCERVRTGETVSRFEVAINFKWSAENTTKLIKVIAELKADLSYADLSYADLSSADLSSADLSYADLSSADLSSANLRSANLRSANLRSADLHSANLSSADLHSANLSYADLRFADIKEIKYVEMSFVLRCELSLPIMWLSLKNATQDFKNYLYVQNMAHTQPQKIMDALNAQEKHPKKIKVKKSEQIAKKDAK